MNKKIRIVLYLIIGEFITSVISQLFYNIYHAVSTEENRICKKN